MNNVSVLNNRLAKASKKFTKACEQIKLLKQQLAVYISMLPIHTTTPDNTPTQQNTAHLLTLTEQKELDRKPGYNAILSREMIRQKIEALQDFKNIVFIYAHQKADEITKLQCELYGEEAVRDAYDNNNAPTPQEYTSNEFDRSAGSDEVSVTDSSNDPTDSADDSGWGSNNYWGNYEQEPQPLGSESSHLTHRPSQLQLVEYDFLTA